MLPPQMVKTMTRDRKVPRTASDDALEKKPGANDEHPLGEGGQAA